jgi:hypothetical protein
MNKQKFEAICRESKMVPIEKQVTRNGTVLLAERKVREPDHHFEVLWAIERDDLDVAGIVKCPVYRERVIGVPSLTTRKERIAAAMEAAKQFIADSVTVGRYGT